MWPGCTSKATFNNKSKYKYHLKNIHVEPVTCGVAGCTYKKPFRSRGELQRHKRAVHTTHHPFVCPFSACDDRRFPRRDKWLQHIRETVHDGDAFCPYLHCDMSRQFSQSAGFQTRNEISRHFSGWHDTMVRHFYIEPYKCALGMCALYQVFEGWELDGLREHLEKHHLIPKTSRQSAGNGTYQAARRATKEGDVKILRPEHLEDLGKDQWGNDHPKIEWQECTRCLAVQQSQQAPQMNSQIPLNFQENASMQYLPQQQLVPQGYQYFMPAGSWTVPDGNVYFGS
ncbi:hypothetical protein B0O99DRAFT_611542 [Bisporella sp. PMI_857]|nr:hypothetical protein B0O99DRAFT_611542 [Bisporella sp. PMI_857]